MQIVQADGPLDGRVAIVGARPGRDEVRTKRSFTGPSGDLLWRLLRVPRSECYVTNVRKDFSPINDTPTKAEIDEALPDLRHELEQTRANVIVALGADALFALTGRRGIENWRGSILESTLLPGRKCIATWHTAAALRTYSLRYIIEKDLRRAVEQSKFAAIVRPEREFIINPEFEVAREVLRGLADLVAVDIETFGDTPSCIGLSDDPKRAICIPFIGGRYSASELAELFRELDLVLRTRRTIGQNFQFDVTRLERIRFQVEKIYFDTMLAHHLLWTELGAGTKRKQGVVDVDSLTGKHSLAFISSIYTEEPFYKWESEAAWTDPGLTLEERFWRYWTYNCKDACVTLESALKMIREADLLKQTEYLHEHVFGLIRPIMNMQNRGMLVDEEELERTRKRMRLECDYLQLKFNHAIGFECNVMSPIDMKFLITKHLGIAAVKRTKKGAPSWDKEAIQTLAYKGAHTELFQFILDIRKRRTLLSNFLGLVTENGYYKAAYLIHGADSGRLSSRAVGKGPQLQNIPKPTRKVFIPGHGYVFVQGDYRRAEAMYVAYDAGEEKLIAIFEDDTRDLYKEVAALALGKNVNDVTTLEREVFKAVVHGTNYGMGPLRFVMTLRNKGIDIMKLPIPGNSGKAKAEYVQGNHLKKFSKIPAWQKRIAETVRETRTLHDSLGRRRVFLGRMDDDTIRVALAFRPSSTVVGLANRAVRILDKQGIPVVSQVHDSVMAIGKASERDELALAVKQAMHCPIEVGGRILTIPVDMQWSEKSWGEMNDWRPGS